jgi:hypothetical protein
MDLTKAENVEVTDEDLARWPDWQRWKIRQVKYLLQNPQLISQDKLESFVETLVDLPPSQPDYYLYYDTEDNTMTKMIDYRMRLEKKIDETITECKERIQEINMSSNTNERNAYGTLVPKREALASQYTRMNETLMVWMQSEAKQVDLNVMKIKINELYEKVYAIEKILLDLDVAE